MKLQHEEISVRLLLSLSLMANATGCYREDVDEGLSTSASAAALGSVAA